MEIIKKIPYENGLKIALCGHITSANAAEVEDSVKKFLPTKSRKNFAG